MYRLIFLSLFLIAGLSNPATAALAPPPVTEAAALDISRDVLEAELGRKLTFKERLAVRALERQQKRAARKAARAARPADGYGNGMAVAGFVCGVVSLFFAGVILGVLGIVFGAIGMRKSRVEGRPLKGLALAGMICGIIGVVGGLIAIAVLT